MENNVVNANNTALLKSQIVARQRKTLIAYGELYGRSLFTIQTTNPDLEYRKDVANGKNTLRQPLQCYILKQIDITSVTFVEKDLDGLPKVILNQDSDKPLIYPLVPPEFSKATRASIMECIERLDKPNSKPMFFSADELPQLTDLLRTYNQSTLAVCEELSSKYLRTAETVRGIMDACDRTAIEYQRQCGVEDVEAIEVNVEIKQE